MSNDMIKIKMSSNSTKMLGDLMKKKTLGMTELHAENFF